MCVRASGVHVLVRVLLFDAHPAFVYVCVRAKFLSLHFFSPFLSNTKHSNPCAKIKHAKDALAVLSALCRAAHKEPPSLSQQRSLHQGVVAGKGVRSLASVGERMPVCAALEKEAHSLQVAAATGKHQSS